jgi:hypothetical protein
MEREDGLPGSRQNDRIDRAYGATGRGQDSLKNEGQAAKPDVPFFLQTAKR